jgi:glycosyltransferase involved in cell wall biosynthesis
MSRIRVVRVIARLNVGGPALHATLLAERLDRTRYDSLLVVGSEGPEEGNYLALHGRAVEPLVTLPTLGREVRGARDLLTLGQLVQLFRRVRPHVVHTHTAKAGALGRIAARLTHVPVVVHTYHGHVFHGYFRPTTTRVFLRIERVLARWTDRLVTVSEAVRQELLGLRVGRPDQFQVIPLGLDLEPFLAGELERGKLRAELGVGPEVPLVGIVARLVPIKAHEVFLEAAAILARTLPAARFVVVGDGERRQELERVVDELALRERVRFLGWRRDLARVYADLDVVALTSRNEGLPVSLIEAMAAARPVVAMRVGGVPDLVEDGITGHLVSPGDATALAHALQGLLSDAERRRGMGLAGRKRVEPAFGSARLLADVDRLYGELCRQKLPGWG